MINIKSGEKADMNVNNVMPICVWHHVLKNITPERLFESFYTTEVAFMYLVMFKNIIEKVQNKAKLWVLRCRKPRHLKG